MAFSPTFGRPAAGPVVVGSGWLAERSGGRQHGALDISIPVGTKLYALDRGVIVKANPTDNQDAGIWAAIQYPQYGGLISRHMHMSKLLVTLGQKVSKGQVIGLSGNTGSSEGPHLHLDLKAPAALLPEVARSAAGTPKSGWIPLMASYGYGIPAEPWIPVDSYRAATITNARAQGIPLYSQIPHGGGLGTVVIGAALGVGALYLLGRL